MGAKKRYSGTLEDFEAKLARVMTRLGVDQDHYQCDYHESKAGCEVFVEMRYGGSTYRFENSSAKSAACGRDLVYKSDLFGEIVYSLEGLARAVEKGIFTLDMLLEGVPALPSGKPLEPWAAALGFTQMPEDLEAVKARYHRMATVLHPDSGTGGDADGFSNLVAHYEAAKAYFAEREGDA